MENSNKRKSAIQKQKEQRLEKKITEEGKDKLASSYIITGMPAKHCMIGKVTSTPLVKPPDHKRGRKKKSKRERKANRKEM